MDETKEMIDRIRESKDRELKRMRDKFVLLTEHNSNATRTIGKNRMYYRQIG